MSSRTLCLISSRAVAGAAVCVCGIWLAWRGYLVFRDNQVIDDLNGRGNLAEAMPGGVSVFGIPLKARQISVTLEGDEPGLALVRRFRSVALLHLNDMTVTGESGALISRLGGLEDLRFSRVRIDDDAWGEMASLHRLETLWLFHTPVNRKGIKAISQLRSLTCLVLDRCGATEEALADLLPLVDLRILSVEDSRITERGVRLLRKFPRLECLHLVQCQIDDAAVAPIADLRRLDSLNLSDNPITDKGVEAIVRLRVLMHLNLSGTQITDEGLEALRGMQIGGFFLLERTAVTDAGVARLREAMPGVIEIYTGRESDDDGKRGHP